MTRPSESEVRPATILLDVQLQKTPAKEHAASLQELRQLIETLGWDIVGTLTQKLSLLRPHLSSGLENWKSWASS